MKCNKNVWDFQIFVILMCLAQFHYALAETYDGCYGNPCGIDAVCQDAVDGHLYSCSCPSGYSGDPFTLCNRDECLDNVDCRRDLQCENGRCVDPCVGACGINANCKARKHVALCSCPSGYSGDPFTSCRLSDSDKTTTRPTVTVKRPGPMATRPRPVTQPEPTSTGDCEIPIADQTEALIFKLHPHNDTVQPGTVIEEYGTVHIGCKNGFFLKGTPDLLCEKGKWNLELSRFPTCATSCDRSKIQTLSTLAICNNKTYYGLCPEHILPTTEIQVKCAYGFTRLQNNKIFLKCMSDGSFDETPVRCDQQECGKISPSATGLSVGGVPIKPSQAPWHVGVYNHDGVRYKYICSGSIISPRIVISAAHCFWDEANDKLDNRQFQIIAGKKSKTYETAADERPQIIEVEQIYIPKNYTGRKGRHLYDIAVVKLKIPLQYNEQCSPICIKTDFSNDASNYVEPDIPGFITAYDGVNNQLEKLAMTTVDYHNCKRQSPTDTPLAKDKFCLRNEDDGDAVCRGDSGAAFVTNYKNFLTDEIIYNLYGVISNTPFTRSDCASSYVAVTSISYITSDFRDTLNNLLNQDKILF